MKRRLLVSLVFLLGAWLLLVPDGLIESLTYVETDEREGLGPSFLHALLAWDDPIRVNPSEANARYPVMTLDAVRGRIHLAWEEDAVSIHYAYRDLGESEWRTDFPIWSGHSPAIAVDADGYPHILYADEDGSTGQSQIHHRSLRQDWVPDDVSAAFANCERPDINLTIDESIHAVWVETWEGVDTVWYARSQDYGTTWSSMREIASGAAPALTLGPSNKVWVAWQSDPALGSEERSDIYAVDSVADIWGEPVNISQTSESDSRAPDIACTLSGRRKPQIAPHRRYDTPRTRRVGGARPSRYPPARGLRLAPSWLFRRPTYPMSHGMLA